jgi:alkylhydroperoxidase/carboxymuconolactone decarboxylase family protein YurZ
MALIRLISEEEATGKVKDIFADIKQTKGIDFVPNIWRALATCPEHLEVTWQKLKTIMRPGKLDMLSKEIIALAVSITNGCEY